MLKKTLMMVPALWLLCTVVAVAADINYMKVEEFKSMVEGNETMVIADIQKKKDFQKHSFFKSIETNAYPVKTESQKAMLDKVVKAFEKSGGDPVIIVGPRGTSAARRAYLYLLDQAIPEDKLFILEGGIKNWPYKKMLVDIAGGCA